MKAIRAGHLRLLLERTAPGGTAILVTDFVSSDTAPALAAIVEPAWAELLPRLIRERNFFTGLNPEALVSLARTDLDLSATTESATLIGPWRWNLGSRWYAVCALQVRKKA